MADKWEYDVVNLPLGINDVKALLKQTSKDGAEIISIINQPHLKSKVTDSGYVMYLKKQTKA